MVVAMTVAAVKVVVALHLVAAATLGRRISDNGVFFPVTKGSIKSGYARTSKNTAKRTVALSYPRESYHDPRSKLLFPALLQIPR